jgi:exosortase K
MRARTAELTLRSRTAAAGAVLLAALGAAFALKRFYSTASAADLRFVLAPTAWLVEVAGGHRFDWTSGGYLSTELRFLVAPACAGVNFLVVAFAALVLGLVRPARPVRQNVGLLFASAAAAYGTTVLANALRILIAIPLWTHGVSFGRLTGPRLHELVGVVVFLGMLLLLHLAARRLARAPAHLWAPLLPYAGLMLVVPLLRGAYQRPEFRVHAAIVAGALLAAAVAGVALRRRAQLGRCAHDGRWLGAVPSGSVTGLVPRFQRRGTRRSAPHADERSRS